MYLEEFLYKLSIYKLYHLAGNSEDIPTGDTQAFFFTVCIATTFHSDFVIFCRSQVGWKRGYLLLNLAHRFFFFTLLQQFIYIRTFTSNTDILVVVAIINEVCIVSTLRQISLCSSTVYVVKDNSSGTLSKVGSVNSLSIGPLKH